MAVLLQIPLVIYSISEENLWNAWRWHFYLFVNILSNPIWSLSTNLSDRAHTASKFRKTGMDLGKPGAVLLIYNDGNWGGEGLCYEKIFCMCDCVVSRITYSKVSISSSFTPSLFNHLPQGKMLSDSYFKIMANTVSYIYIYMYISVWMVG